MEKGKWTQLKRALIQEGRKLDNRIKLMRTSSRKTGARTEAKSMAVISAMRSERKPWTMEHSWEEGRDRKFGRKGSQWAYGHKGEATWSQHGPRLLTKKRECFPICSSILSLSLSPSCMVFKLERVEWCEKGTATKYG